MRSLPLIILALLLLSCSKPASQPGARSKITLDELAVAVRTVPRSYMLSDRTGAFVVGKIARGEAQRAVTWSVDGDRVPGPGVLSIDGRALTDATLDSARVRPDCITRYYADGTKEVLAVLDGLSAPATWMHAMVIDVVTPQQADVTLGVQDVDRSMVQGTGAVLEVQPRAAHGWALHVIAADSAVRSGSALTAVNTRRARFALLLSRDNGTSGSPVSSLASVDSLLHCRTDRMEALLNASYVRTSDDSVNAALWWVKLFIDAMTIEGADTIAVAGIPWDGSLSGRDMAQSIAGIGLATGDYQRTHAIVRSLAGWQDRSKARSTYGRIADWVSHGTATYDGADVGPWFVRELYEHVTYANDTVLAKELYPAVKRSIEGTLRYHTDAHNFLVHGEGETWMSTRTPGTGRLSFIRRGNRAVEIQLLWYFQQLIGSFLASYVGDTAAASSWSALSQKTSASFDRAFLDTVHNAVYDHLTADGRGVADGRPNPLLALEIIGSEAIEEAMIRDLINAMVYEYGVGTLDHRDPRFHRYAGTDAATMFNGPVWTWLNGQLGYALSRYDRQNFSFQVMNHMVRHALGRGMVGALPAMMNIISREDEAEASGAEASLTGMAEFVRSFYQDYIGLRIDAPSNQISIQPKLPSGISQVDFTVTFGGHPVNGRIERGKEISRLTFTAPVLEKDVRLGLVWMLDNGDAWRASAMLKAGEPLTVVISAEDILAYGGDTKIDLIAPRKLRKFSMRDSFTGFDFADPGAH